MSDEVTKFAEEGDRAPRGNPPRAHPKAFRALGPLERGHAQEEETDLVDQGYCTDCCRSTARNPDGSCAVCVDGELTKGPDDPNVEHLADLDLLDITARLEGLGSLRERVIALEARVSQLTLEKETILALAKRLLIAEDTLERVDRRVVDLHEDVTEISHAPAIESSVREPRPLNPSADDET